MLINKKIDLLNETIENEDSENEKIYKWLCLLIMFIWIFSMFVL